MKIAVLSFVLLVFTLPLHAQNKLAAAQAAFAKAQAARAAAEQAQDEGHFYAPSKEEIPALKQTVRLLTAGDEPLDHEGEVLLYKAFSRLLQLNQEPPACMLCHQSGVKIAGSHYVSSCILSFLAPQWSIPESNQVCGPGGMTLPLFCTNGNKGVLRCEQRMSEDGEKRFGELFLPFIQSLIDDKNNEHDHALDYNSWLFHCVTSLAFRVFISDLENPQNWITNLENTANLESAAPSLWRFFRDLRDHVLRPTDTPGHRIFLFLSEDGIRGNNELDIAHTIGSFLVGDEDEQEWVHSVLFSLRGFHFLIVSRHYAELMADLLTPPAGAFAVEITPGRGRLDIPRAALRMLSPFVKEALNVATQNVLLKSAANPAVISESAKGGIQPKKNPCDLEALLASNPPNLVVRLPDFLKFRPASQRSPWRCGSIVPTREALVQPIALDTNPEDQAACWLLRHSKANYHFAIIQVVAGATVTVLGYEYDPAAFSEAESMRAAQTGNFTKWMQALKPLRTTDHQGIYFYPVEAPALYISMALMRSRMPRHDDEIRANRASIESITTLRLANGDLRACTLRASRPDGNCGFTSLDLTREAFIKALVQHKNSNDPRLVSLILAAMRDDGAKSREAWHNMLEDRAVWMTHHHMRLASYLFGLRIFIYHVPAQNDLSPGERGDIFVPHPEVAQHVIDETQPGATVREMHIAWTTMEPMTAAGLTPLNHFDRILIEEAAPRATMPSAVAAAAAAGTVPSAGGRRARAARRGPPVSADTAAAAAAPAVEPPNRGSASRHLNP